MHVYGWGPNLKPLASPSRAFLGGARWVCCVPFRLQRFFVFLLSRFVGHAPGATPGAPPSAASVGLATCWLPSLPDEPSSNRPSLSSGPSAGPPAWGPAVVLASSAPVLRVWVPPVDTSPESPGGRRAALPPALSREGGLLALAAVCTPAGIGATSSADSNPSTGAAAAAATEAALTAAGRAAEDSPGTAAPRVLLDLGENLRRASAARAATHAGVHLVVVAPRRTQASRGRRGCSRGSSSSGGDSGGGSGGGSSGASPVLAVTADGSSPTLHWWALRQGGGVAFLGAAAAPESTARRLGGVTALACTNSTSTSRALIVLAMHRHGAATLWLPGGATAVGSDRGSNRAGFVCKAVVPCPVLSLGAAVALKPGGLAVAAAPDKNTLAVWAI